MLRLGGFNRETSDRALEIIERNCRAQVQLVADLLDLSRIVSGKLTIHPAPMDLTETVRAAVDTLRPTADLRGIALEIGFDTRPCPMLGDADRLQQAVWNLLSNAIKFTPAGGRVSVHLVHAENGMRIVVSDTGIGLAAEFLPYIFDRFRQVDSSTTRAHGGLGLGLGIVRSIVELHGGAVSVDSPGPGHGATFTVTLPPRAAPGVLTPARAVTESMGARLDSLRILVVDDERDERELFTTTLERQGATVEAVAGASEAVEAIEAWRPDALVSDIAMPGRDGYWLIEAIRTHGGDRGRHLPAMAVTAYARVEDRARALAAGFERHISKPVDPSTLVREVALLTGRIDAG